MSILRSRWFRLLASLGLLSAVVWFADVRAIRAVLSAVDGTWVLVALALTVLDRLLFNFRWQILLIALGLTERFMLLLRIQLAANLLGSFLPGSLGVDAIRIAALCRAGLPASAVVAATLVDRATILVARLLFGSAMILAMAGTRLPVDLRWWVLVTTATAIVSSIAIFHPSTRRWVKTRLITRFPPKVHVLIADIASATLAFRYKHRAIVWIACITIVILLGRVLFTKALVVACGADVSLIDLLVVVPILWIVVLLPITIGGIGLQEVAYVTLMGLLGVSPAVAVSMSLIEHVVTRLVSLPGVFFLGDVTGTDKSRQ